MQVILSAESLVFFYSILLPSVSITRVRNHKRAVSDSSYRVKC